MNRAELRGLTPAELKTLFLEFKKEAQTYVRKECAGKWDQEIAAIKPLPNDNNVRKFSRPTIDRTVDKLDQEFERMYIIEFIIAFCEHFQLDIDQRGGLKKRDFTLNYLCYYWKQDNVNNNGFSGINASCLSLSIQGEDDIQWARLQFFGSPRTIHTVSESVDVKLELFAAKEDITISGEILFLTLTAKGNEPRRKSQLALLVRSSDKRLRFTEELILGTYSSFDVLDGAPFPVAGFLLLQRKAQYSDVQNAVKELRSSHPDWAYHFLFRTRLSVPRLFPRSWKDLPGLHEVEALKSTYTGIYKGEIIGERRLRPVMETMLIQVFSSTHVRMHVPDLNSNPRPYNGRIRIVSSFNDNLVGYFDFDLNSRVNRFTMYIQRNFFPDQNNKETILYGVYAGIEFKSTDILAGPIRLTKIDDNPDEYHKHKSIIKREPLFDRSPMDTDLWRLFLKKEHGQNFVRQLLVQDEDDLQPAKDASDVFPYAGDYFIYSLASDLDGLWKFPIRIKANGSVEIKVNVDNPASIFGGKAHCRNSFCLSITITDQYGAPYSHYLFNVIAPESAGDMHHCFGASAEFSEKGKPTGKANLLVREEKGFDQKSIRVVKLKIDTLPFNQEDATLKGLLSWLTGRYSRLAAVSRRPNEYFSRRADEFVDVHFYSACHLSRKGEWKQALIHLYQAYLHGFCKINLIDEEITDGGALFELVKKDIRAAPFENKYKIFTPLTGEELIERIRQRATHILGL
ncbi:MAG: hypothetical protein KA821_06665 [Chitinophagaceae bacterium]|nr:hypothetical protein [Chitinophagaceae bacterium]